MFKLDKTETQKPEGLTIEKKKEETEVKKPKKKLVGSIIAGAGIGAGILYAMLKKGSVEECDLVDSAGSDDDGPEEDEEFPDPEGE